MTTTHQLTTHIHIYFDSEINFRISIYFIMFSIWYQLCIILHLEWTLELLCSVGVCSFKIELCMKLDVSVSIISIFHNNGCILLSVNFNSKAFHLQLPTLYSKSIKFIFIKHIFNICRELFSYIIHNISERSYINH